MFLGFFITVSILILKDLQMSILSTILYKMSSIDLNLRQYFLIDIHDLQKHNYLINELLEVC